MSKRNAEGVFEHLQPHCDLVRKCRLTFKSGIGNRGKHQITEGCYYEQTKRGNTSKGFMILDMPKCAVRKYGMWGDTKIVQHNRSTCFNFTPVSEVGTKEWFIAGYFLGDVTEHQPLGVNCLIHEWTHDEPLDYHERSTYQRVEVEIEWL